MCKHRNLNVTMKTSASMRVEAGDITQASLGSVEVTIQCADCSFSHTQKVSSFPYFLLENLGTLQIEKFYALTAQKDG